MVDQTTNAPARTPGVESDLADAGSRLEKEGQALSETLANARESVVAGASDLGARAAARLEAETQGVRDEATAGLVAFSDALKAASAELSGKRLGFAGDVVQQAASGLETLARSFEGRSPGEMLEAVRSFGRQNPVGFIAGSVLAGFALGRVAAAAAPAPAAQEPDLGRSDFQRPDFQRPDFQRSDFERPDFERPSFERSDFDRPAAERDEPFGQARGFQAPQTGQTGGFDQ